MTTTALVIIIVAFIVVGLVVVAFSPPAAFRKIAPPVRTGIPTCRQRIRKFSESGGCATGSPEARGQVAHSSPSTRGEGIVLRPVEPSPIAICRRSLGFD